MLAMPTEECCIGSVADDVGKASPSVRIQNLANAVDVIDVVGQQDALVVRHRQQATVEHPVHRAGQRQAVLHDIRPLGFDRFDVRGFDFRAPAAVDELKPRERAALS